MENYEEKYKEALKVMESLYNVVKYQSSSDALLTTQTLEKAFPELRESDDERIRKELIEFVKSRGGFKHEYLAWLEKQGEQKPVISDNALREGIAHFGITQYQIDNWLKKYVGVEKQDGQKTSDKVEPEFRNGQWIVWQNKSYKVNYDGCGYELIDQNGLSTSLEYEIIDENAHLWDITKDAKDSDVLCSGNPFIFSCFGDKRHPNNPTAYCGIDSTGKFILSDRKSWWTANKVNPATKEQRELLFQKMKEAGYEWDAEKKELKKIEQNTAWSVEDKIISNEIQCLICNYRTGDDEHKLCSWIDNLKDRVQP